MWTGLQLQEGYLCWLYQISSSSTYRHELHLSVSTTLFFALWVYTPETIHWHLHWHAKILGTLCNVVFEKPGALLLLATAFLISWITLLFVTQEGCQRVTDADTFVVRRWQVHFLPSRKTTCKSHKSLKLHMTPDLWTGGWIPAQREEQADRWTDRQNSASEMCWSSFMLLQGHRWPRKWPNPLRVFCCFFSGKIRLWLQQRLTSI